MNKAFVKEPDDTGAVHCPKCGSLAIAVGDQTLTAQLPAEDRGRLPESAWYCPYPRCDVAYFDKFERSVSSERLAHAAYPKDPTAPICACFGFTCDEIEQDVREHSTARVKALLAKAKSTEARCRAMSPSGESCQAEVQRYFMKFRQQWSDAT
jgi:hypothetical protein